MGKKEGLVKRNYYLDLLDRNTASFRNGDGKNIALLGPRKCGKTSILKQHLAAAKDVVGVFIDLNKTSLNPENFSVEFIGNVIFNFLKKPLKDYKKFLLLENILKTENELKSKNAFAIVRSIENELQKIKPDQKLLVQNAFGFAKELGKENSKKFLIALDNIESLLDLNNFSQVKDVISLMDLKSENARYIAASSAIRESIAALKGFECYEIKNLERNESIELAESIIGKDKACEEIWGLSKGHPLVTTIISKKYNELKSVKKSFLIELLAKDNALYGYCSDSYNYYYNRARGQTLLKTILKIVANEELRLSDIAKRIYRSAPVTKSILERLMDVDVIYKKGNKFYFTDDVLRLWVKLTSQGYDFDDAPDDKVLEEVMKEL